ncbi:hypothetical protein MMC22_009253 [Lobaria immixta]|nr:hypothetical protein [Lobaria immixta]
MTEISTAGRINEPVFQGITGTLFGLAILTATVRTVYRVQSHGRLLLDDYMLIFACVTLTVANGILFSLPTFIYWNEIFDSPPRLAYNTDDIGRDSGSNFTIPANAVFLFDVDLDDYICGQNMLSTLLPSNS